MNIQHRKPGFFKFYKERTCALKTASKRNSLVPNIWITSRDRDELIISESFWKGFCSYYLYYWFQNIQWLATWHIAVLKLQEWLKFPLAWTCCPLIIGLLLLLCSVVRLPLIWMRKFLFSDNKKKKSNFRQCGHDCQSYVFLVVGVLFFSINAFFTPRSPLRSGMLFVNSFWLQSALC